MAGVDLAELPLDRFLNVVHHLMVEDQLPYTILEREEGKAEASTRELVKRMLNDSLGLAAPYQAPDPETWGLLPEHQRSLQAAVGFIGGPATPQGGGGR